MQPLGMPRASDLSEQQLIVPFWEALDLHEDGEVTNNGEYFLERGNDGAIRKEFQSELGQR